MESLEQLSLVREADAVERVVDDAMTIRSYFSAEQSTAVDLVAAELDGLHSLRVNRRSTKLYYVERGTLDITIDGRKYTADAGSTILVRVDEEHEMVGHAARVLIICSPAFDPADEEILA
ncbi:MULTISPECIES: AraC family ligand binding domain-containing protein [unclassified Saccharothrix]|uniref:AraC family ligand binding domain-containing protein n=1 Tax=unclassified Saccharothrix TaxID=2593673 RepID=UPI00307E9192